VIHDLVLRWLVTGLFVLSAAECVFAIITQRRPWTSVVSNGLHFVMAVAMVVMAWPWSAQLPTTEPAVFFLLAAVWFVTIAVVAAQTTAHRVLYGYHALMMLATAWMYPIMNGDLLPLRSNTKSDMPMPSMPPTTGGMSMPPSGGAPVWFTAVGWFGTLSFAAAAVFWTYRYFIERHPEATRRRSLGSLCQAMMATGMTIFFLATLFSI
jgi:hypothetical protein